MLQLGVNAGSWHGGIQRDDITLCSVMMEEFWMKKKETVHEEENNMQDTSGYGKSGVRLARLGFKDLISVI